MNWSEKPPDPRFWGGHYAAGGGRDGMGGGLGRGRVGGREATRGAGHMLSEKSQRTQNGTMFVDLDWPLNASRPLSASAELLVYLSMRYTALLRRLPKVDLIILDGEKTYVRPSVRPSTKSLFDLNEIWYIGRGRWVCGMPYGRIQGQGQGHEPLKVWIPSIFKTYLLRHLQWELASDH